jgi:hypothetical protein
MLVPVDETSREDIELDWGEDRDSGYTLAAGALDENSE